ncbi:MAG: haloalkane dehalogenase [Pseudomonadales bacterium]|nr:haloalkane dehalogenase [Pseudomonadales bacterium]
MISSKEHPKKTIKVNGKRMSYVEMGKGDPIVFQHGNPTSSYLWRNIMPALADKGRCIAVDLIGMGDSDKLDNVGANSYSFDQQAEYLYAAWQALGISENVTLVIHDWGSALGFYWASLNPDKVKAIAYMEGIPCAMEWADWPAASTPVFKGFRSAAGEDMVLKKNIFVEKVLPGSVLRGLSDAEMAVYRRPFANPGEDRRPTLSWPRQIPLGGEPEAMVSKARAYATFMAQSPIPKLFINAEPGAILVGAPREYCRAWPNQTEVTVKGSHFIQEDSPAEISAALAAWYANL